MWILVQITHNIMTSQRFYFIHLFFKSVIIRHIFIACNGNDILTRLGTSIQTLFIFFGLKKSVRFFICSPTKFLFTLEMNHRKTSYLQRYHVIFTKPSQHIYKDVTRHHICEDISSHLQRRHIASHLQRPHYKYNDFA